MIGRVHTVRWVTISVNAVPQKKCRTLATDTNGENLLSEVVDIVERGNATVKNVKCCICDCVGKLS